MSLCESKGLYFSEPPAGIFKAGIDEVSNIDRRVFKNGNIAGQEGAVSLLSLAINTKAMGYELCV
ncbi:hypothetical protein [Thalassomonas sp. RHCl1]|uniref:hypothetical protein n=1 Tax=Thalassomonas sp. RHCl1 TaxID=2995320 RepID=UPI00248A90FC|nr:hypothetical protein [Thalassomonas sp. RHCl1]